jgi:hypothetical protein
MNTLSRRLRKLEDRFGLRPETEFERKLREAMKAGERRLAQARERGACGPDPSPAQSEADGQRMLRELATMNPDWERMVLNRYR